MKTKKGFTLVELLGVVVLLSVISLLVYVSVTTVTGRINDNVWKNKVKMIEESATRWGEDKLLILQVIA